MPPNTPHLLLVEDDGFVAALSAAFLRKDYDVRVASTAAQAYEAILKSKPDLILLDLGLPDEDGLVLARQLKARASSAPIIFVTSRTAPEDVIAGLELGGDDYVTKPYNPDELRARIDAVLRRCGAMPTRAAPVEVGTGAHRLTLDPDRRRVETASGTEIQLTRAEFDILGAVTAAQGRILSRGQLLDAVATSPDHDTGERVVDALVSRIRRKLVAAGLPSAPIETVRGLGYRAPQG